MLACTVKRKASTQTDIITALDETFASIVYAKNREKSLSPSYFADPGISLAFKRRITGEFLRFSRVHDSPKIVPHLAKRKKKKITKSCDFIFPVRRGAFFFFKTTALPCER